tara:strand:+ start:259 stop:711 length:453 start_codon:yes stop_codon:yes gene_type:complete
MELSSLIALIFGVYGSIKFSDFTFSFFSLNFPEIISNIDESYLKIASFVFTFLLIIILISIAGKVVTKLLKFVFLGLLNKILGGFFGSFKFLLFISLCVVFTESLNYSFDFFDNTISKNSIFYGLLADLGNNLISLFNSNKESINFFNGF